MHPQRPESDTMSHDLFLNSARTASELRVAEMLGRANAGPTFVEHLRQLAQSSQPTKRRLSTAAFRRDLTTTTASAGGFLTPTGNTALEEFIRPYLLLRDGGLNILAGLDSPITVPRATTVPTATWLATQASTPAASDPVFGQVAVTPKMLSIHIKVSRQLLLLSNAEAVVGPLAAESIARGVEAAIFNGTGASGQPLGVMGTAGVTAQSGTSLAAAGLRAMRKNVLNSGAREDRMLWVGATDVQELLGSREFSAGSGRPLWDNGMILGRPAIASSLAPAGTLICGDWSRATAALFDAAGAEAEVNPYENFQSGVTAFRLMVPCDVFFSPAAAFAVATSIT